MPDVSLRSVFAEPEVSTKVKANEESVLVFVISIVSELAALPVVSWLRVGILAASNVPDVIFDAAKFPTLAAAKVPDEILLAVKFVTDEPLPLVANLPARAFVIVVENEASSFIAAANSFKVFNAPGLESTKLAIAVSV